MTAEDQPASPPTLVQQAIGTYIAQAAQGGTATVNVYQYVSTRAIDEAALRASEDLLATMPYDHVPSTGQLPPGSRMMLRPNPLFTGRTAELVELAASIGNGTVAVGGVGGVGKTQLAVEFAHRYGQFFAGGVQWLSFAEPGEVPAEIAACGDAMAIRPDLHTLPLDQRVEAVLAEWQQPLPRLLVFDNCDDENLLATWRPTTGGARVLVTSHRRDWDPALDVRTLPLEVLSIADSVELIHRFRPDLDLADPHLAGIADELGGLPLALHLAANYLRTYRHVALGDPAAYLALLTGPNVLAHPSMTGETERFSPTGHERNVANTFAISFRQITGAEDLVARRVLVAVATMAPGAPVPRELLHRAIADEDSDAGAAELAITRLEALGLITQGPASELQMHRLIVAYVRTTTDDPAGRKAAEDALFRFGREAEEAMNYRASASIERHLRWVADHVLGTRDMAAARWANLAGNSLIMSGDSQGAHSYLERSYAIAEELLEPNDRELALYANDLGHALMQGGEYARSIPYLERAIPLWEQGNDQPNLAATLDNLGQALIGLGQDAGPTLERALAIRTKVLGASHLRTSVTLYSLGRFYQSQGQIQEARRYFNEALTIRMAAGNDKMAANSASALGALQIEAGDLSDAKTYVELAMSISRRELKADDWNTLGYLAWAAGDYREALQKYSRALAVLHNPIAIDDRRHAHSRLLSEALILNNIGMARLGLEEYAKAEQLFREAFFGAQDSHLQARTKNNHLQARIKNNLGVALTFLVRFGEAEDELNAALVRRRKLHGDVHPDVATTIDNIGRMRLAAKDLSRASEDLRRAYEIRTRNFPAGQIEIAKSLYNLGCLAAAQNDETQRSNYFKAALTIRERYIPQHPDTAATLVCLGRVEEALKIYELRFGPNHPRSRSVKDTLLTGSASEPVQPDWLGAPSEASPP